MAQLVKALLHSLRIWACQSRGVKNSSICVLLLLVHCTDVSEHRTVPLYLWILSLKIQTTKDKRRDGGGEAGEKARQLRTLAALARGPEFSSQYPRGGPQLSVTVDRGIWHSLCASSSSSSSSHVVYTCPCRQNTHAYKPRENGEQSFI